MPANNTLPVCMEPVAFNEELYHVEVSRDIRIPTSDPTVTLAGDVFRPIGAGIVPALLTLLPYRKDAGAGIANEESLRWFAARGYASVLVDFRGIGSSDGQQRPPFDPLEADDGVAAVAWTAEQPWCNGSVGMWGHSYGAVMSMRTASRRPPQLKAIIPVMGMLDPERDFVHPSGIRGCLGSLAQWGTDTLLNQLLPPLEDYGSATEQRRWHERLQRAEPWLVDLFRNHPGSDVWRSRAIDASTISIPSYCVAGWRDLFCDATIRAFEQINGPKKLLAGPWMHTMPERSPFIPVDFRVLALRWWQHWLSGIDTGFLDEPAVTLYRQGSPQGWAQFESWPPVHRDQRFATVGDTVLRPREPKEDPGSPAQVIAAGTLDPTVGVQSGLWGLPTTGFGLPLDQHDDDMRSLSFTSEALTHDLPLGGRPVVFVRFPPGGTSPAGAPSRLIVRLTDVDEQNRSTLITTGVVESPNAAAVEVVLTATCYAIPSGHRVRVVLSDADFPRLWPAPTEKGRVLKLQGVEVCLPVVVDEQRKNVEVPVPDHPPVGAHGLADVCQQPLWTVTRDLINDSISVTLGEEITARTPNRQHLLEMRREISATARGGAEGDAAVRGMTTAKVQLATGETISVRVALRMTEATMIASGQIDIDGSSVFARNWVVPD